MLLGCLFAIGSCVAVANSMSMSGRASPSSVDLPPWRRLNGAALRSTEPQSIEILVEEPSRFRTAVGMLDHPYDADAFERALKDPAPSVGKILAKAFSKKFDLAVRGIRASDDQPSSSPSDLSLYVRTVDWAVDCPPTCAIVYRVAVRIEDNRSKAVIAAGNCEAAPAHQLLEADQDPGARTNLPRVRMGLSEALDECTDKLRHDPLGLYGTAD